MEEFLYPGAVVSFSRVVAPTDLAHFDQQQVHDVYATFALTRDAEWTTRQFILPYLGQQREGIGTYVEVKHLSPAFLGDLVTFRASIVSFHAMELHCLFEAFVGERKVAEGKTGQKILEKQFLLDYLKKIKQQGHV
jgi:fluoroacetyl-CoA thioesterase